MSTSPYRAGLPAVSVGVAALSLLTACGSVSQTTKDRVARSETAIQQAQQTMGNAEQGAVELQRARDNLEQARQALKNNNAKKAEQFAIRAELDAELAVAKSQSAAARKAADELQASIQTLKQEAARETLSSD